MAEQNLFEACPRERLDAVLQILGEDGQAGLARLDELLMDYAGDPELHFLRGSVLAGLGRFGEAQDALAVAARIAPDYLIARFQLGLLQLTSGDTSTAAATWAPLQSLDEDHALRLFANGLLHMAGDEFSEAVRLIKAGMDRNVAYPPLNGDMQMVLDQIAAPTETPPPGEEISSAHFLLQQYASKPTRH